MPVFALGRSANVYVIYKDEITAEAVQSPLFSYVTFAKVVKITGITLQINRNPAVLSQHGRTQAHEPHKFRPYVYGLLCSIEDYMNL